MGPVSVRIHTRDNVYGLDPDRCRVTDHDGGWRITSDGLTWAGGEPCTGAAELDISTTATGVAVTVRASHPDGIRTVAVTLHDRPPGTITGLREAELAVPAGGRLVEYPNGWFDLATPFLALRHDGGVGYTVARSTDDRVRAKRFAVIPHAGGVDLDLLVDAEATAEHVRWAAPAWHLDRVDDLAPLLDAHTAHCRRAYQLPDWETRDDVPAWMREVSLVVALHGQHFTGRIFHDYAGMLRALERLAAQLDGRRILAYLPGWEGRYYRWYGRYGTDPRMGGEAGFAALVDGAHALGIRVMPMFGANLAARDLPGFETWAAPGLLMHPSGGLPAGSVDWDGSRHYDHGTGALVNPAYAPWRSHLVNQVTALYERFGFDAAFLDISALYSNDPRGDTTEGLRRLAAEVRAACPGLMLAGEGWFDALGGIIPLVQTGHRDTVPVFHDEPGDLFTRTNRSFGHLCLGDPAHHSTGVHEAGYNPTWRLPLRRATIPTLALIDSTLDDAPGRVKQILDDARRYADEFLT